MDVKVWSTFLVQSWFNLRGIIQLKLKELAIFKVELVLTVQNFWGKKLAEHLLNAVNQATK